jgi:hypothetical protein
MMNARFARRVVVSTATVALVATLGTSAATAAPPLTVLADGLSSPKGVSVTPRGNPLVAQGAFGAPGPVLEYLRTGPDRGTTVPVSDPLRLGDVAFSGSDGAGWGITGDRLLVRRDAGGTMSQVLDIAAYQAADPDPHDQDGDGDQSNPYGLTALPNGDVLVVDAQNNDMLRVSPDGTAVTVARFLPRPTPTDHLAFPLPPVINAEAVPTGVSIGRDGWAYVSQLTGFPFRPGFASVFRVNPWTEDAECSTTPNADCATYVSGFTALVDVAVDPNNGTLYAYSLADDVFAWEEAVFGGVGDVPPAVLTKVNGDHRRELVAGQLFEPGGVTVAPDGTVFATDHIFSAGRLLQIRG